MSQSTQELNKKSDDRPIDKKQPGAAFLLAAISFMVVLVLGVAVMALYRAW